jgi:hypothetical protein
MDISHEEFDLENAEFEIWLKNGYDRGWVSDVFCNTHEGPPLSEEEMRDWDEGNDPCSFQVKINMLN